MVHAELAAILSATARINGVTGSTLYIAATYDTGAIWGGPPCLQNCCKHVADAGIARIVTLPPRAVSKWREDARLARGML